MNTVDRLAAKTVIGFIRNIANLWFDGDMYAALDGIIIYVDKKESEE